MLEYDVKKSPGLGAFFAGQNQADSLMNTLSNRNLQGAQVENIYGRLKMDQDMHPLKMEETRLGNLGKTQANRQATFANDVNDAVGIDTIARGRRNEVDAAEMEARRKSFESFMDLYARTGDVVQAGLQSGIPNKVAQKFAMLDQQLSPEQKQKMFDQWASGGLRSRETQRSELARSEREERNKEMDYQREITKELIRARTRISVAASAGNRAQSNKNYQQAATHYYEAAMAAAEANDMATAQRYAQASADMQKLADQQARATAAQRSTTQPDLGALGIPPNTGVPVSPPPVSPLLQPQPPQQPVYGAPPPGAVRPRN